MEGGGGFSTISSVRGGGLSLLEEDVSQDPLAELSKRGSVSFAKEQDSSESDETAWAFQSLLPVLESETEFDIAEVIKSDPPESPAPDAEVSGSTEKPAGGTQEVFVSFDTGNTSGTQLDDGLGIQSQMQGLG